MRIVIATGIYPPEIGGIATYADSLAKGLSEIGHQVTVVTYGSGKWKVESGKFPVMMVEKSGGMFSRWRRYAKVLKTVGADADVILALSSVSVGVPLWMSGLTKPKRILRLGGDFFWERYTDAGGMMSLKKWYAATPGFWKMMNTLFMARIFRQFQSIVYSTAFQKEIHEKAYRHLPMTAVIENAGPTPTSTYAPAGATADKPNSSFEGGGERPHQPFRLLFMGRFVGFKNIPALIEAMKELPEVRLTIVGDGPMKHKLQEKVLLLDLAARVTFLPPARGSEKQKVFAGHDALIIPSVTEISPNVALEASAAGLPVLLTEETGLSPDTFPEIRYRALRTPDEIATAVHEFIAEYALPEHDSTARDWPKVIAEWDSFLKNSL